jgi:hypothetical protein
MTAAKRNTLFALLIVLQIFIFASMTMLYNMFRFFYELPEIPLVSPNDPFWRGLLFLALNVPAFVWLGIWSHRQYIGSQISRKALILGAWFGVFLYYYASDLPFEIVIALNLTGSLSINLVLAFYFALMPISVFLGLILAKVAFPLISSAKPT